MKNRSPQDRLRIARAINEMLPEGEGGYEASSAFTAREGKRLLGTWEVAEHLSDGIDIAQVLAGRLFRGRELRDPAYAARYRFSEGTCVKRALLEGRLDGDGESTDCRYRMSSVLSWTLEPGGRLRAVVELGYQITELDGRPAAVREAPEFPPAVRLAYSFDGPDLLLEEGSDRIRLRRVE